MVDGNYIVSLLGCANLIELTLLAGGFLAVCLTPTEYGQTLQSSPDNIKYNTTSINKAESFSFSNLDIYTIKQTNQAIIMIIFVLTFFSFLTHILFAFRYRYSWHRLSISIAFLCIIYAFALFGISVLVACWEDSVRKQLNTLYFNNQFVLTSESLKSKTGSAAAAATFGFAACLIYLAEALIRFRRLADKIQT